MNINIDTLRTRLEDFESQNNPNHGTRKDTLHGILADIQYLKEQNPVSPELDLLAKKAETVGISIFEKEEAPTQRLEVDTLSDECESILKKYGCTPSKWGVWCSFQTTDYLSLHKVMGYENARKQWKLFLNPNREHLAQVLEKLLSFCTKNNIPLIAKYLRPDASRGPMGSNALNDPCEPKIAIYFTENTSQEAKVKLKDFVVRFEQEFSKLEIETWACQQGEREIWQQENGSWKKKNSPQWGPSFCVMYNKLFFYTQGGYTESGRNALVENVFLESAMNMRFQAPHYALYAGEIDPFSQEIACPKEYISSFFKEKIATLPSQEQLAYFQTTLLPLLPHDKQGCLFLTIESFVRKNLKDNDFLQTFRCAMDRNQAESCLASQSVDTWLLRYSNNAKQYVVSLKSADTIKHYEVGSDAVSVEKQLEKLHLKHCISPLFQHKKIVYKTHAIVSLSQAEHAQFSSYLSGLDLPKTQKLLTELADDNAKVSRYLSMPDNLSEQDKDLWMQQMLTELGGSYLPLAIIEMSHDDLYPHLADLLQLLKSIETNSQKFTTPFSILKLHNLKTNLAKLKIIPQKEMQQIAEFISKLIEQLVKEMSLPRQRSLVELFRAKSIAKDLVELVQRTLFKDAKTENGNHNYAPVRDVTTIDQLNLILLSAQEVKETLEKLIKNPHLYHLCKAKFPVSMQLFIDREGHHFELLKKKVEKIIIRQKKRLQMAELGHNVRLPTFFHGTKDLETAFHIMSSSIRPSPGSSWYGSFISTYPAMLRYGSVILGLPTESAFQNPVGLAKPSFRVYLEKAPLFMPDKRTDVSLAVFRDKEREKWIGFHDHIFMSGKAKELRAEFLQKLRMNLQKDFEKSVIEKDIISPLLARKFTYTFIPNDAEPSRGTFVAQINHTIFSRTQRLK